MVTVGALLSTLLLPSGPTAPQLPATSHTVRLFVKAFAVSDPAGTDVVRLKLASAGLAKPDPLSAAVHAKTTSDPCQKPSADPQVTTGASRSDGGVSPYFATKKAPVTP